MFSNCLMNEPGSQFWDASRMDALEPVSVAYGESKSDDPHCLVTETWCKLTTPSINSSAATLF